MPNGRIRCCGGAAELTTSLALWTRAVAPDPNFTSGPDRNACEGRVRVADWSIESIESIQPTLKEHRRVAVSRLR